MYYIFTGKMHVPLWIGYVKNRSILSTQIFLSIHVCIIGVTSVNRRKSGDHAAISITRRAAGRRRTGRSRTSITPVRRPRRSPGHLRQLPSPFSLRNVRRLTAIKTTTTTTMKSRQTNTNNRWSISFCRYSLRRWTPALAAPPKSTLPLRHWLALTNWTTITFKAITMVKTPTTNLIITTTWTCPVFEWSTSPTDRQTTGWLRSHPNRSANCTRIEKSETAIITEVDSSKGNLTSSRSTYKHICVLHNVCATRVWLKCIWYSFYTFLLIRKSRFVRYHFFPSYIFVAIGFI